MPNMKRRGVTIPPTASEVESAEVAFDVLRKGSVQVGQRFTKPDDDWSPIWLVLTPTQGTTMTPESMRDNAEKNRMVDTVAAYAQRVGAVAIGHLNSSWQIPPGKVSDERMDEIVAWMNSHGGSTEGVPEREEIVLIAVYTATTYWMYTALITRHENAPPTLGSYELMHTSSDKGDLSGRMVDPLRDALRRYG